MTGPQPPQAPVELRRPRDLGAVISDGLRIYFRAFPTFIAIAFVVVVPVELIVRGVGMGQFTARYDATPAPEVAFVPVLAEWLVISPLLTSMCIFALLDVAEGRKPRLGEVIQRGLDLFRPLLVVMALAFVAVFLGLLVFIVGAIVAAVYLAFVVQAAVLDRRRGADALRRSFELVQRSWWRVFAIAVVAFLVTYVPAAIVSTPLVAVAESSDRAVYQLIAGTLGVMLSGPPLALMMTLLYFDQRARKGV